MGGSSPEGDRAQSATGSATEAEETVPWRTFFEEARSRLAAGGFDSPDVDARRIVERAAGIEPGEWPLRLSEPATQRSVVHFDKMVSDRLTGKPLQYVVGSWGFRNLDLMVDSRVLIPRPETELVAEFALAELARVAKANAGLALEALDLGTGSGCIGLSLATENPIVQVTCTDVSPEAIAVARANLAGIGRSATRVRIIESDWFEALDPATAGSYALIVSNPPYVADGEAIDATVADWEPPGALYGGPSGFDHAEAIISTAASWLLSPDADAEGVGGALVLELATEQLATAAELARSEGFAQVEVQRDLTNRDRILVARRGRRS